MFTGLIEDVGRVATLDRTAAGLRLTIQTTLGPTLRTGDSVAVNGVCLTVTAPGPGSEVSADIGPETAHVTTLAGLQPGQPVNVERPVAADGRFGGHLVQGHVDGMGTLLAVREEDGAHWMTFGVPGALEPLLIAKGSVCVDGVSLTVAHLGRGTFDVMVIPHTWTHTNLGSLGVGAAVNIECDLVGKYVARSLDLTSRSR